MSIKFHLPDFWSHGPLNLALIDMIKEHPEYFRDGVEIASVYGCFPPAVWNGGRNINGYADERAITHVLDEFNKRGIPCRFTFTNPLLTEEHMSDRFCNRLVQLADNGLNEAIVNTQVMEDYLRANYPNYKLTSSTCKQIRGLEPLIKELKKDYSLVVLDYNWNNDFEALEKIPEEYRGKIDKLNYRLGVAMTRFYYNQSGKDKSTESYSFNPSIVLHYAMSDNSYLRWKGNIYNASPSLGDLSDVEQAVDSFQIRRGNPHLKSYMCYHTELTYEWKKGIFYTNLWGAYDYRPNAIMDEKIQEGNKIVQTWDNQKDWQKLSGRAMLRVGPIRDILQFSFTGGVNHYMSHGNHYSHTYTNWFCEAEASLNYKQFSLFWQINTNWNNFWGETLSGGENIQMLAVYYKHKNLRVGVGAFNPFTDNYKVQSENWNKFASYKTNNYIKESSRMFLVNFSYNFSFGRSFKTAQRKVNNSDNDSGVMGTGK